MKNPLSIELLAPAKNGEYGKIAINHGADAVYIGASKFGARSTVANSVSEIEKLVNYAHIFRAKVYATLNTILFDHELEEATSLIGQLYHAGVDGLIVQDMGILEMDLPPIPLIASTQTHNITPEKVLFLEKTGFKRVILARELSLMEIASIRSKTTIELETFVHGALCVSYSGRCYMSQAICQRSGNRGMCAQPCRSVYDLIDRNGETIVRDKHLLSLKDLHLANDIEALTKAGISSFKIEGRLKDEQYLKNITALYRQKIDNMLEGKTDYRRSSSGKTQFLFAPDPEKTFNRGFTLHYLHGRKEKTASLLTQKSIGKRTGKVTQLGPNWFTTDGEDLCNADGICFFDSHQQLKGTMIHNVKDRKFYPNDLSGLSMGTVIYRNHDQSFCKILQNETSSRKISIVIVLDEWENGFTLQLTDKDGCQVKVKMEQSKTEADKPEKARVQIIQQLSKLGNTHFEASEVGVKTNKIYFIQASALNQLRREGIEALEKERCRLFKAEEIIFQKNEISYPEKHLTYAENVSNQLAQKFYRRHGAESIEPAFELISNDKDNVLMTTKHCIRFQLDACPVYQKTSQKFQEPLYLKDNHHTYRLDFDCKRCEMKVVEENHPTFLEKEG